MTNKKEDSMTTPEDTDQTIEQRIDEILDFHALNHSYKSWSSKDEAKQSLVQLINEARFDELTKLGKLYNGSRKNYIYHYEGRYKYLKTQLVKENK